MQEEAQKIELELPEGEVDIREADVDDSITNRFVTDEDMKFWLKYGDDTDFISVVSKAFTYMTLGDLQYVHKSFEQREIYEECQILKECILDEERYLKIENYIKN